MFMFDEPDGTGGHIWSPKKPHLINLGCIFVFFSMAAMIGLIVMTVIFPSVFLKIAIFGILILMFLTPIVWIILYMKGQYG